MSPRKVTIDGYLTEAKLAAGLKQIVGDRWTGVELKVAGTRRRWDMGFEEAGRRVVVEYDGDEHYRNTLKIKIDREKDEVAKAEGLHVVRMPYWVQLDRTTLRHFFGLEPPREARPARAQNVRARASRTPPGRSWSSRTRAGSPARRRHRDAVVRSLADRAAHGAQYVLPASSKGWRT
jgi:hypothetical protein